MQETGRAGRTSSEMCKSVLLYSSLMLKYCHDDIKTYAKKVLTRKMLLSNFDADLPNLSEHEHAHQCCDVCQRDCEYPVSSCDFVYFDFTRYKHFAIQITN